MFADLITQITVWPWIWAIWSLKGLEKFLNLMLRDNINLQIMSDLLSLPAGRLSAAVCRLCHGKFSPRSLRHAFDTWPQDSIDLLDDESDATAQSPLLFHTDFQRLVGVQLDRDPRLSEFICKKCHAKFYKCHSILIRFLQRVNLPLVGKENVKGRWVQVWHSKVCVCCRKIYKYEELFVSFSGRTQSVQSPQWTTDQQVKTIY